MATITKPMALDESFNTTESTPRSQADVLAAIESAIRQGFGRSAADVSYDNTTSGLTADDVQEAIDELADEKVDKVAGKGLSSNDFTDEDKEALANMELDIAGTKTVSGNPITLTDAAPINAESLVVELEPIQGGSGDPSPTNIRPITGYTECDVDDVADNLYDKSSATTGKYMNLDGTLSDWVSVCYSDYIRVKPNTSYYFSHVLGSTYGLSAICFDGFKNPLNKSIGVTGKEDGNGVVTTPNDCAYIVINAMASNKDIVQITEGSTAPTTYQPYQSTSATIQFGQTVYGGRSNFTDGGTERTKIKDTIPNSWDINANHDVYWLLSKTVSGLKQVANSDGYVRVISDKLRGMSASDCLTSRLPYTIAIISNSRLYMVLKKSDFATLSDVNTWCSEQNIEICYEVETPTQLSTPPTDLKLLKGTNNLSTNGTTINLGYQPDNVIGDVKGEIEKCAVDAEFMQFTDGTDTFTDVNLSLNASLHTVLVVGSKIEQKRFICFEVMDKMGGILQGILASGIAFTDGAKTPSGTAFRAYIESVQMYVNFRIHGSGGSYTLAYQSETSFSASAFYVRVRMMNNL